MGYKKYSKDRSFSDLEVERVLDKSRSVKLMEKINKSRTWRAPSRKGERSTARREHESKYLQYLALGSSYTEEPREKIYGNNAYFGEQKMKTIAENDETEQSLEVDK